MNKHTMKKAIKAILAREARAQRRAGTAFPMPWVRDMTKADMKEFLKRR